MKIVKSLLASSLLLAAVSSHAEALQAKRTPFNGTDLSGVYACVGNDIHDGDGASTLTLTLDSKYSSGKSGAFKATVVAGPVTYSGSVVSNGKQLAMDFANSDLSKKDYGVALGTVKNVGKGKFRIQKFYYEPEYSGGSNGFELCTSK